MKISLEELIKIWDEDDQLCSITCSDIEGKNIINLIKNIARNNFTKVIEVVNIYLKSLNKKYLRSYHVLELYKYLSISSSSSNINILHLIYPLVRDYWNILEKNGHCKVSICYYNQVIDLYDNEESFFNKEILINDNIKDSFISIGVYSIKPPGEACYYISKKTIEDI